MKLLSAVVIVAPPEVQAHVQPLHWKYRGTEPIKVPAHFTVLYPFVTYDRMADGLERLRRVCRILRPFEITVDEYATFPRVVYLQPRDPGPIRVASRARCAEFPECPLYDGPHATDFKPHMTVTYGDLNADQLAREMPSFKPFTFTAECLHVYVGNDEVTPWLTAAIIPVGESA